ncbi:conserved hypothetical protein [Uncinocarpus reesii 1704]|uniref:CCHC-type domain-containing protein n=1 Tax=Uncinocarpus reesii (strain UAMH 1704) TaxID=336963 RepID=C4JKP5_UNCRE|nr:uncharacterized protein UREG_00643 [Uncinocarpus reesii 1704]EEP75796.1 conserved hypothetical protein [Uncinocarpus reesii 1704]
MGHTRRGCKQEQAAIEKVEVKCVICKEPGHRARDCTQPRKERSGCQNPAITPKNALNPAPPRVWSATDASKLVTLAKIVLKKEPITELAVTAAGHMSRDCPEKKDWSKVQCSNCKEMGHTYRRCKQPIQDANGDNEGAYGRDSGKDYGNGDNHGQAGGWQETPVQANAEWVGGEGNDGSGW